MISTSALSLFFIAKVGSETPDEVQLYMQSFSYGDGFFYYIYAIKQNRIYLCV